MTPRRVILVVVFLVVWGLITHGTYAGSGDEPHYLIIAQSLAFDGDLDLANNYAQPGNLIGAGGLMPEAHARPGRNGVLRPIHDIGLPLIFVPYVRVTYPLAEAIASRLPESVMHAMRLNAPLIFRHFISLGMAVLTSLLGMQLFALFMRTAASPRQAMWWALLLTLSPPLLSHAFLFFTEIPSALLVIWLVKILSDTRATTPSRTKALLVGAAIGLLLLIHVRNIALVAVFLVWAAVRLHRLSAPRMTWWLFGVGAGGLLLIRAAVVFTFWGTLLTTPIARPDFSLDLIAAARETVIRAFAVLFNRDFGLLIYAPIYVLGLTGLWVIRQPYQPRAIWALLAAYLATLLVPYTNPWGVSGGFAPAARMIVPVVPLLALAVFERARTVPMMSRVLVAVQIAIDLYVWQWPKVMWSGQ